jgi:predicted transcriptional regulator
MITLTIKISSQLAQKLRKASARAKLTKSELARRALEQYIAREQADEGFVSALDRAGDAVGCFAGGPKDLASNPKHLTDFGRV